MNSASDRNRYVFFSISLAIVIICAYLQISHFLDIPKPYQEPDSFEFLYPESAPQEWGSIKPPFVPFVYKLLGRNLELITMVQLAFSLISWSFLAYVIARSIQSSLLIPVAFAVVLGLSLGDAVSMWNRSILSESFSLSLFACFTGVWFLALENVSFKRVMILITISVIFALTRTANGFTLLMLAVILIISIPVHYKLIHRGYYLSISIVFITLFIVSNSISNTENRWAPYFLNVMSMRILTDQEMKTFFEASGMPVTDSLMARSGKWSHEDDFAYYNDPDLEHFRDWLFLKGKSTYAYYLLTHPKYSFFEPLRDFRRMMFSVRSRLLYYAPKGFTSPLQGAFFGYLTAWSLQPVYYVLAVALFALNIVYVFTKKRTVLWIPLIMILLVYPLAVLTWHADAMEIERHALPLTIQAHLGFILLFLFAVDITFHEKLLAVENYIIQFFKKKKRR